MTQDTNNLPDLPELEAVEARGLSPLPALALLAFPLLFTSFAAWGGWVYRDFLAPHEIALIATIPLLFLYVIFRFLTDYYRYNTNADGFSAQGLIRRRSIRWTDINGASIQKRRSRYPKLILRMDRGSFRLPLPSAGGRSPMDVLVASVYQHLRRLGKADGLELTPSMLSLWREIPDDVPTEAEWGKPASLGPKLGYLFLLLLFCAYLAYLWTGIHVKAIAIISMSLFTLMMLGVLLGAVVESLRKAYRARVTEDGLEAGLLLKTIRVPWSSIRAARWRVAGQATVLSINSAVAKLDIPFRVGSKESEQLTLAIIRQLRTVGHRVTWPALLSQEPDLMQSGTTSSIRTQAFLNSLSEPARSRLKLLYAIEFFSVFLGALLGLVLIFIEAVGRLSAFLYTGGGARYFISAGSLWLMLPLFIGGAVGFYAATHWIAGRLVGPYKADWQVLHHIMSGSRADRIAIRLLIAIAIVGVLAVPLYVNCYMKVTDQGITVNRLSEFKEESYRWQDISGVQVRMHVYRDHGHRRHRYSCRVTFRDGMHWTLDETAYIDTTRPPIREAGEFIIAKSGRKPLYR